MRLDLANESTECDCVIGSICIVGSACQNREQRKAGAGKDYTCEEVRGKMKVGENEKARAFANGPPQLDGAI